MRIECVVHKLLDWGFDIFIVQTVWVCKLDKLVVVCKKSNLWYPFAESAFGGVSLNNLVVVVSCSCTAIGVSEAHPLSEKENPRFLQLKKYQQRQVDLLGSLNKLVDEFRNILVFDSEIHDVRLVQGYFQISCQLDS